MDLAELSEITEVRLLLEPLAAWRAARSAPAQLRQEIRQRADFLDELDPKTDERTLMRHDMAVHRLIYRAGANSRLEEVLIRYDDLATRIWPLTAQRFRPPMRCAKYHLMKSPFSVRKP